MSVSNTNSTREAYGRTFSTLHESYILPVDRTEHKRLDGQHELIRLRYGGLYLRGDDVRRVLAPRPGYIPKVLDIGTGSGIWAVEMAYEFPDAQVLGIDIVQPKPSMPPPPNCQFKLHDANRGFDELDMSFDLVNIRCAHQAMTSQTDLVASIVKILRPGGLFLSLEGSPDVFDEVTGLITAEQEEEPGFSWTAKLLSTFVQLCLRRNPSSIDVPNMPIWLKKMDCWEEAGGGRVRFPVGSWEQDEREKEIGKMMLDGTIEFINLGVRPTMESGGYPSDIVDTLIENTFKEIKEQQRHLYFEWPCAWAIKKRV
ncbi:hypothetical protein FRB94_002187 [Tulasnella sp. JGI-2019a]|nr:hypothetical protein FRB93_003942 [Tulasnella sp. JGI-2019a]KAG9004647.1 hypothetical protein FRB94_002187 [Tulasnella sp. JGI-2019a]